MNTTQLKNDEKAVFALRELYGRYGYIPYKMSKFEEYDLYVRNKDFLISDSVITFTDTNGKLMALKPDVTLSIVKNSRDGEGVQKLYYHENVYRVSGSTHTFKEIVQAGLECIGEIDDYCVYEVLMLAAESLRRIADTCVLDISHMGILSALLEGVPATAAQQILRCVGDKNVHELASVCDTAEVAPATRDLLVQLVGLCGKPVAVLPRLGELLQNTAAAGAYEELCTAVCAFDGTALSDMLRIDFSVVSDARYYSGIVFKGFVDGVPESVLSGGRYDHLMRKMHRRSDAIGFAVYLDRLERLGDSDRPFDVDAVLLYGDKDTPATVARAVQALSQTGSVTACRTRPEKVAFRQLWQLNGEEAQLIEDHA
ncbi:MAG: ATP phosphoribosyltransferase regulatory subunit [Clostridia bacterium]|nr:ATP phosphoribosyltransferase regulatory subunit [Clostridia bacterium]